MFKNNGKITSVLILVQVNGEHLAIVNEEQAHFPGEMFAE